MKFTDQGFTLMEMLVVMMIGAITLVFTLNLSDLSRRDQARMQGSADAMALQNQVSSTLAALEVCNAHFRNQAINPDDGGGGLNTALQNLGVDIRYVDVASTGVGNLPTLSGTRYIAQRTVTRLGPYTVQTVGIRLTGAQPARTFDAIMEINATASATVLGSQNKVMMVPMTVTLNPVGTDTILSCTTVGGSGGGESVPAGAVMAFNLAACPSGWTAYANGVGRMIIGQGARPLTDPKERSDWNWWTTQRGNQVMPPGPASINYALDTQYGSLFHTEYIEQMAEHWHWVLNLQIPFAHMANAGGFDGFQFFNSTVPSFGFPGGPSIGGGGMGGAGSAMGSPHVSSGLGAGPNMFTQVETSPPGTKSLVEQGMSGSHTMLIGDSWQGFVDPMLAAVPAGGNATNADHTTSVPGIPVNKVPPWQPPPDPFGWYFYNALGNTYYSYGTTSCTLDRTPCQPPGFNFYQGMYREGDGTWSSRGNFVLPPTVALLYCQKD